MDGFNVRFVTGDHREAMRTRIRPGYAKGMERIKKELAEFRALEPSRGWHVETCGNYTGWHDWKEIN